MGFLSLPRENRGQQRFSTGDLDSGSLYQPLSLSIFNVWCQKKEEIQKIRQIIELREEAWPNRKKLGVGKGHIGFRFQFCSLLVAYAYSTSLYLHSLFSNITFIYIVAVKSKYFIASVQHSSNRAAIIVIMMTDIIIITT